MPSIHFMPDDITVDVEPGESILQASLRAGIPHTHVCGGKARCTTCRVLLMEVEQDAVSSPNESEYLLSSKLGFSHNIRLACQSYVSGNIRTRRLVIDEQDVDIALMRVAGEDGKLAATGIEKELVILFADIREFTAFSDRLLPYDVIHMLNRYFFQMRRIIERNHGEIYNYMGDGLLALFGVDGGTRAAENGVRCGIEMLEAMQDMQGYLVNTYGKGLEIGIGLHCGDVVIGSIDNAPQGGKLVIGDAVNFASRVESANKNLETQLLVSEAIHAELGERVSVGKSCSVDIKGKSGRHRVYEVSSFN